MRKKKEISISEVAQSFYDIFYSLQRTKLMLADRIKDPEERQKERKRILSEEPPEFKI